MLPHSAESDEFLFLDLYKWYFQLFIFLLHKETVHCCVHVVASFHKNIIKLENKNFILKRLLRYRDEKSAETRGEKSKETRAFRMGGNLETYIHLDIPPASYSLILFVAMVWKVVMDIGLQISSHPECPCFFAFFTSCFCTFFIPIS